MLFYRYQGCSLPLQHQLNQFLVKTILIKISLTLCIIICSCTAGDSQTISAADRKKLAAKEDSLKDYARFLVTDSTTASRMISDSIFTRVLVRALRIKNSFYYPFDSVMGVSKLYAPDSSFRIFTWNIQFDDFYGRQKGAIQMRTPNGSLKLIPLRDYSEFTTNAEDSVRTKDNWIGAMYYNIIKTEHNGRSYYTLFGFDGNTAQSSKKWIEVMYFNPRGEPVFGGPFFTYQNDEPPQKPKYRLGIEYKKDAKTLMNYVDELEMILVDHLISETDQPELKWTYVPDGDNEGYKWENGKWVHLDKAFDFKIDMRGVDPYTGKPPVEHPILDSKGNKNEKKLEEQSNKNKQKEEEKPKPPM
jgi:hypothetical protein